MLHRRSGSLLFLLLLGEIPAVAVRFTCGLGLEIFVEAFRFSRALRSKRRCCCAMSGIGCAGHRLSAHGEDHGVHLCDGSVVRLSRQAHSGNGAGGRSCTTSIISVNRMVGIAIFRGGVAVCQRAGAERNAAGARGKNLTMRMEKRKGSALPLFCYSSMRVMSWIHLPECRR